LFAAINENLGDFKTASECFEVCLRLKETLYGFNESYTETQYLFAELQLKLGDEERALNLFLSILKIRKSCLGVINKKTAQSLKKVSDIFLSRRAFDKALEFMSQELKIVEEMVGKCSEEVSNCRYRIGNTHFQLGCYEESARYFSDALRIREGLQCDELTTSKTLYMLGRAYFMLSDFNRACDYFNKGKAHIFCTYRSS
jgi:tetratricopeptide (TPR) repeat protein